MVRCPACRSQRVYKGYRLTPLLLRVIRIHEFLCEDCNLQFRAFSLLPPRTRKRKRQKNQVQNNHLPETEPIKLFGEAISTNSTTAHPIENPLMAQASSSSPSTPGQGSALKKIPLQNDPPEALPKVNTSWEMPAQTLEEVSSKRRSSHRSHQVCPHCGATDTERRRRKLWEKAIFVFTNIRAYSCRICGGDFYARRKNKSN